MTLVPPVSAGSLNVVALISGGKDSIFSLLHCLANGHKIIALANLHPASQNSKFFAAPSASGTTATWDYDVDSFMYQTAGHNLIPLYSDALNLPLYRQEILGGARDSSLSYSGHDEDETEALVPLLNRVKKAHPEINSVGSGAILSTYQRSRVESVAIRLGLVPLAFLWQYPSLPPPSPGGLLQDMGKAGFDIRIIKVASGGLSESLLWSDLATPPTQRKLEKAMNRFGGSVLGEGGEYETMVVSGPSSLLIVENISNDKILDRKGPSSVIKRINHFWNGRIDVSDEDRQILEGTGSDTAILLFRHGGGRISSTNSDVADSDSSATIRPVLKVPSIWDDHFHRLLQEARLEHLLSVSDHADAFGKETVDVVQSPSSTTALSQMEKDGLDHERRSPQSPGQPETESRLSEWHEKNTETAEAETTPTRPGLAYSSRVDNLLVAANLTGLDKVDTAHEQMRDIKQKLLVILKEHKRQTSSIIFTTILLSSMSDFATINQIYGELFEHPNPPARVTVACPLPLGIKLMVSVAINLGPKPDALHVQSRSYWAPANIGPYSQAIRMPSNGTMHPPLVFIAGQIPLIPATMELLPHATVADSKSLSISSPLYNQFLSRCCLSLQHLWRVGREMKVSWWTGGVAFIIGGPDQSQKAALAWRVWRKAHVAELWEDREEDGYDDDSQVDVWDMKLGGMRTSLAGVSEEHRLPDFDRLKPTPQGALSLSYDKETEFDRSETPGFFAVEVDELPRGSDIEWQGLGIAQSNVTSVITTSFREEIHLEARSCIIGSTETCVSFVSVWSDAEFRRSSVSTSISRAMDWIRNVSAPGSETLVTCYTSDITLATNVGAQIIPCHAIWGSEGRRLIAGIVAQFKICHGMEN